MKKTFKNKNKQIACEKQGVCVCKLIT